MCHTLCEFVGLREHIIKNHVLNTLLIANISNAHSLKPITVATILLPITQQTKEFAKTSNKKPLSDTLLYDVVVQITPYKVHVGLRYAEHPIIWNESVFDQNYREFAKLKIATQKVVEHYPISNKEIFPTPPKTFKDFVESNNVSFESWQNGEKINVSTATIASDDIEIDQYFETLNILSQEYQTLDHFLIILSKNYQRITLTLDQESLKIMPSAMNNSILISYQMSNEKIAEIIYISELTPLKYFSSKIPLTLLKRFMDDIRLKKLKNKCE